MIEVTDVVKRFSGERTYALDGATLRVDDGELAVLVGPSGSGKSTLLHLVAGLDRPTSGSIVVNGRDLHRRVGLDAYRRNEIGIVFQLHNLLPHLSARANLEVMMLGTHRRRAVRRSRATELLDSVGLATKVREVPTRLSGGERQRVAFARALVNDPPVLLADEPTGSLDDATTKLVVDIMRSRTEAGGCVLAVTHDARLLSEADRVIELVEGRVVTR